MKHLSKWPRDLHVISSLLLLIVAWAAVVLYFFLCKLLAALSSFNTPPQDGVHRLCIPILTVKLEKRGNPSALVIISATWCLLGTWRFRITPSWILSLTRWQSISMCFVLSWNTRLATIWIAAWLSEKSKAASGWNIRRSLSKDFN